MKFWLLNVGEPLPTDAGHPRLHRTGFLADVLTASGHDVVWWSSTFRHAEKDKRFVQSTAVQFGERLKIWCLDSRPYRRNVSPARIRANYEVAAEFRRLAESEAAPDAIFCSYPIPELALAGADYAAKRGIPAAVDIRDLWPDIWPMVLPKPVRAPAKVALWPFDLLARRTLRRFDAICGLTDEAVDWGLAKAGRAREGWDRTFPLGYSISHYPPAELSAAAEFWDRQLGPRRPEALTVCYVGNITARPLGLDMVVEAAHRLPSDRPIQIVICGDGEGSERLRQAGGGLPSIVMPGRINGPQIQALADRSDIGLLPYPNDPDFVRLVANKAIEYLAFGLPILTGLEGATRRLIETERCGYLFRNGDAGDLAAVLSGLWERRRDVAQTSRNATATFEQHFQAARVYGDVTRLLEEMADSDPFHRSIAGRFAL